MTVGESLRIHFARQIAAVWPEVSELRAMAWVSENWDDLTHEMAKVITRRATEEFGEPAERPATDQPDARG